MRILSLGQIKTITAGIGPGETVGKQEPVTEPWSKIAGRGVMVNERTETERSQVMRRLFL